MDDSTSPLIDTVQAEQETQDVTENPPIELDIMVSINVPIQQQAQQYVEQRSFGRPSENHDMVVTQIQSN
jgi:hypothetical protein